MDYTNWLTQSPYHWTQDEKEAHYVPLLFELTSQHCHRCPPYGQAVQTLYEKTGNMMSLQNSNDSHFLIQDRKSEKYS